MVTKRYIKTITIIIPSKTPLYPPSIRVRPRSPSPSLPGKILRFHHQSILKYRTKSCLDKKFELYYIYMSGNPSSLVQTTGTSRGLIYIVCCLQVQVCTIYTRAGNNIGSFRVRFIVCITVKAILVAFSMTKMAQILISALQHSHRRSIRSSIFRLIHCKFIYRTNLCEILPPPPFVSPSSLHPDRAKSHIYRTRPSI